MENTGVPIARLYSEDPKIPLHSDESNELLAELLEKKWIKVKLKLFLKPNYDDQIFKTRPQFILSCHGTELTKNASFPDVKKILAEILRIADQAGAWLSTAGLEILSLSVNCKISIIGSVPA